MFIPFDVYRSLTTRLYPSLCSPSSTIQSIKLIEEIERSHRQLSRALQVELSSAWLFGDSERDVRLSCVGVKESVPPHVPLAEEVTSDGIPVLLGVLNAGDGLTRLRALVWLVVR